MRGFLWRNQILMLMIPFKTKLIRCAFLVVFIFYGPQTIAQFSPKTVRVSFFNETLGLPSWKLTKLPINPAFSVGTDLRVRSGKHWQKAWGVDFYYYYQQSLEHALMLDASYRLGYRLPFSLQANLHTALGYKHAILAGQKYELKNGEYQRVTHFGKAQANIKLGLGLEYPLSKRYAITADYKTMVVAPFGDRIIPFSIHTFLGVGLKINLHP